MHSSSVNIQSTPGFRHFGHLVYLPFTHMVDFRLDFSCLLRPERFSSSVRKLSVFTRKYTLFLAGFSAVSVCFENADFRKVLHENRETKSNTLNWSIGFHAYSIVPWFLRSVPPVILFSLLFTVSALFRNLNSANWRVFLAFVYYSGRAIRYLKRTRWQLYFWNDV